MHQPKTKPHVNWQTQLQSQKFTFAKFDLELIAEQEINLPKYKGSALRGGFGNVFRKVSCTVRAQDCSSCLVNESCPYSYIFDTP